MADGWRKSLKRIELNLPRLEGVINDQMLEYTKEGARIWLREALSHIPTWSGASRATFEALAQSVGFKVTYGPITAFYNRKPLGASNGFGGWYKEGDGHFVFYYSSTLDYLNWNDQNEAPVGVAGVKWGLLNATPYYFTQAANEAFLEYASSARLPPISYSTSFFR